MQSRISKIGLLWRGVLAAIVFELAYEITLSIRIYFYMQ